METSTYGAALVAIMVFGFTGSLHCAAMCGPLAASACGALAAPDPASSPSQSLGTARRLLAYHLTRLTAYTTLGVGVGLGAAVMLRSTLQSYAPPLGVVLGAGMLVYATIDLILAVRNLRSGQTHRPPVLAWAAHGQAPAFITWLLASPLPRPVTLGLATALLPCGFLYAALAQAALLAHPFYSGAAMAAFAVATGPALLFGATLLAWLRRRLPRSTPVLAALLLLVTSACLLARAVSEPHVHHGMHDHPHH